MTDGDNVSERIAFLLGLRARRDFRPDPVPRAVIDDLLRVARWSGTASNRQPWELVLVQDRETLRALAAVEGAVKHLAGAALGIVLVMAGERERVAQETFDEGRLSERIMLAAAAHGVASCIGWFVGPGRHQAKAILVIPPERLVRTELSLGYSDEEAHRARPKRDQVRKPLPEFIHSERYGRS